MKSLIKKIQDIFSKKNDDSINNICNNPDDKLNSYCSLEYINSKKAGI